MDNEHEISVGPPDTDAAIIGITGAAIQTAVDAVAWRGGGKVNVLPGEYILLDSIRVHSNVHLCGTPGKTIMTRNSGIESRLTAIADGSDPEVCIEKPELFSPGMGICILSKTNGNTWSVTTTRVLERSGNKLIIDGRPAEMYKPDDEGRIINAFSFISCVGVSNALIEGILIKGDGETAPYINGCIGGGIYLRDAKKCTVRTCEVYDFNGDGISFQITDSVSIEECLVHRSHGIGIHPGTGSFNAVVRNCRMLDNQQDGLYLCWSVRDGIFENNIIERNQHGISIGHKDTDNVLSHNTVRKNRRCGIYFRSVTCSGDRNRIVQNLIEDNGTETASPGIHIEAPTSEITIEDNAITNSTTQADKGQSVGILIEEGSGAVHIKNNRISGHAHGPIDDRARSSVYE